MVDGVLMHVAAIHVMFYIFISTRYFAHNHVQFLRDGVDDDYAKIAIY